MKAVSTKKMKNIFKLQAENTTFPSEAMTLPHDIAAGTAVLLRAPVRRSARRGYRVGVRVGPFDVAAGYGSAQARDGERSQDGGHHNPG